MKKNVLLLIVGLGAVAPVSAQVCNSAIRESTPMEDFFDNYDGTVTHVKTGLIWKKCSEGQDWTEWDSRCTANVPNKYTWKGALKRVAAVNKNGYAGFNDWRIPNINELASIVEDKCYEPAINTQVFAYTPNTEFWSGSPMPYSKIYNNSAWIIDFIDGFSNDGYKVSMYAVRLVRGKQCFGASCKKVLFLLHGMNSGPQTWNDLVRDGKFPDCPVIYAGEGAQASPNSEGTLCYRVKFGAYDAKGANGLENAKAFGEANGIPWAGDFSTFEQLGREVERAVQRINKMHPNAKIVLLGHSRGGLAARAFLQEPVSSVAKDSIAALITTGTPHGGSPLGKVYPYIKSRLLDADGNRVGEFDGGDNQQDWEAVKWLNGEWCSPLCIPKDSLLDVRRPVISYLRGRSEQIRALMNGASNLPATAVYGKMSYSAVNMGVLSDSPLDYTIFGNEATHIGEQLSDTAEAVLLGDGKTPADYPGDGIVTSSSQQRAMPWATRFTKAKGNIVHIEEPGQTADIMKMFCKMSLSGWLSACSAAAQAAKAPALAKVSAAGGKPSPEEMRVAAELENRHREYETWLQTPGERLWTQWRATSRDADAVRRELLGQALMRRVQQGDGEAVYRQAEPWLGNTSVPLTERAQFVAVLGETATPQALQLLLRQLQAKGDSALRNAVLAAIGRMGDYRWQQRFHDELSPVLQSAWRSANSDAELLIELAQALAKVGEPQGVALLLQAVERSGQLPKTLWKNDRPISEADSRAWAAWLSLHSLRNPDAVPVLAAALQNRPFASAAFQAAGDGLAAMGLAQATEVLLQWAEQAPDEAKFYAQQWFGRVRDEASLRVLRSRMLDAKPFRSRAVRDAVNAVRETLDTDR